MMHLRTIVLSLVLALAPDLLLQSRPIHAEGNVDTASHASRAEQIYRKLSDPQAGVFVVAHRGCHNPSPLDHMDSAPENSLLALAHCVTLGVDMMELDIHRTKDGALVIMHDDTVDRTTNGSGKVSDLTLAQIKALRLRRNSGGSISPLLTDESVPTLDEILQQAKGRILLNLDIKGDLYRESITAAVNAVNAGMAHQVLVKKELRSAAAPLADQEPYAQVPFQLMVTGSAEPDSPRHLATLVAQQSAARKHLISVEMILLSQAEFDAVAAAAATAGIRLWATTLNEGAMLSLTSIGGDIDALRDPESSWGYLIDHGATILLSDEPGPLLRFLKTRHAN